MKNITYKWVINTDEIDDQDWTKIFGTKLMKSRTFFKAMYETGFKNVSFYFLLIYADDQRLISILPCFLYNMDLLDIMVESNNKKLIQKIRKHFPNFMMMKTLTIGSYASSCEYFVGTNSEIEDEIKQIKDLTNKLIQEKAKEVRAKLMIIKEVRESQIQSARDFFDEKVFFFRSFPNTFIPASGGFSPYPIALKKKHRKRFAKYRSLFDERFEWSISNDFDQHAELFGKLYMNVLKKAKNKFEVLNGEFFRKFGNALNNRAYFSIAREKDTQKIRLIEFIVEEEDRLVPLYLGIDYQDDEDTLILYLNTIFRTIKIAEEKGKGIVEFGQTSYYPKVMSGALAEYIYYGFSSYKKTIRFFIKHIFKYLFAEPHVPENVYKEFAQGEMIKELSKKYNFTIIN